MRIGVNRTGFFPSQPELMQKLGLNPEEFNELIIDAKESGRDIKPETFELNQYSKISISEIKFGTDLKEPFGYKDFVHFHNKLSEKIASLNFGDDEITEDILELAGTIVNYLEILLSKLDDNENSNSLNDSEEDYSKVMKVYGDEQTNISNHQIQSTIDNFLIPLRNTFNKIGIIYESYDTQINEPYNEVDIVKNYETINFGEIKSLIRLYEEGQLT